MSTELRNIFPVTAESFDAPCVDLRKLHEWLGVGRDFTNWVKGRVEKYGFQQDADFVVSLAGSGEQVHGGQNRTDYITTIDMAKELAMVENNPKGREVRRYFIDCERQLRSAIPQYVQPPLPALTVNERIDATDWLRDFAADAGDDILMSMSLDLAKNIIVPMVAGVAPNALPAPALFQTFEVLEDLGADKSTIRKEVSYCGRLLAMAYRSERGEDPKGTTRVIDGAVSQVKCYPNDWRERANAIIGAHIVARKEA